MQYLPNLTEFAEKYNGGIPQLVWTHFLADLETPVSAMLKLMKDSKYHVLLESVEGGETRARYSIIALDPDVVWKCVDGEAFTEIPSTPLGERARVRGKEGKDPFSSLRKLIKESKIDIPDCLPPMAAGLFGYMGYDMVKLMERLPDENPDTIGIPDSIYIRPRITVIFDSVKDEAIIVTPVYCDKNIGAEQAYKNAEERLSNIVEILNSTSERSLYAQYYAIDNSEEDFKTHITREKYHEMVNKAKEYIKAGDIFQVVPSRRLSRKFELPPFAFYRSLRHLNPSPYLFYIGFEDFSIAGSSPEIMVRLDGKTVTIRPIAGTRKRGKNEEEDLALEKELLADEKELAEHLMLLDLGRNDTGRVSKPNTVKVTEQMIIERYSHVMHIVSNVEGEILPDMDCIDALIAGFPAGTVSGAPKIRAMEIIDELESEKRSFYGGTVGYISANGSMDTRVMDTSVMDTCITLRTALIKDNTIYLQAGGGVVADSDPEAEFQETTNKANALIEATKNAVRFI